MFSSENTSASSSEASSGLSSSLLPIYYHPPPSTHTSTLRLTSSNLGGHGQDDGERKHGGTTLALTLRPNRRIPLDFRRRQPPVLARLRKRWHRKGKPNATSHPFAIVGTAKLGGRSFVAWVWRVSSPSSSTGGFWASQWNLPATKDPTSPPTARRVLLG